MMDNIIYTASFDDTRRVRGAQFRLFPCIHHVAFRRRLPVGCAVADALLAAVVKNNQTVEGTAIVTK